jgi:DNA-binding CsgD family transcriptional regulator
LSEPLEPNPPAPRRDRSRAARSAARQRRAEREAKIVDLLNRGLSIAEIADREGVGGRAMRKSIRTLLARRAPAPPAEFLALQVSRLNEALLVAYGAMSAENLEAVDRVVKIVRELDRYHGFAVPAGTAKPPRPLRLPPPSEAPLVLEAPGVLPEPIGAATD